MNRGYLNRDESNQFMVIMAAIQLINGERSLDNRPHPPMWEEWSKREMMDKAQQKNLKMANTYLNKFVMSKLKDLDKSKQIEMLKKIQKFDFKLADDYTLKKLFRDMSDKMQFAVMKREDFYKWTEEIMTVNCLNCNKDRNKCELHRVFEDNLVPETGWNLNNCEYAYIDLKKVQ